MPKRRRENRIEGESARAFADAIAPRLLYRGEVSEYEAADFGIDGSVEEFDDDDETTGTRFLAQLKATDQTDGATARQVSLSVDHARYYRRLALPVLMVRYVASSRKLYVRWFHQFDPEVEGQGEETLTFRWAASDELTPARLGTLAEESRLFLNFRAASLALPLGLHVEVDGEIIFDLPSGLAEFVVQELARWRPDIFTVVDHDADALLRLRLSESELVADLGQVASATFHLPAGGAYDPGEGGAVLAADALVFAGLGLARLGQSDLASRIAAAYLGRGSSSRVPEVVGVLADAMTRARRVREALDLSDELDRSTDEDSRAAGHNFLLVALAHSDSLSDSEVAAYHATLEARIERRLAAGQSIDAARATVSLANSFRSHDADRAIALYERAAELEPSYRRHEHWWTEYGSVLFSAQRFADAAAAYETAIGLGSGGLVVALFADAKLFSGRYGEAAAAFSRYFEPAHENPPTLAAEWRLKAQVLLPFLETLELEEQERDTARARERFSQIPEGLDPAETVEHLVEVLLMDALLPEPWERLVEVFTERADAAGVLQAATVRALLDRTNPDAWRPAIVMAITVDHPALAADLLLSARTSIPAGLVAQLYAIADDVASAPEAESAGLTRESYLARLDRAVAWLSDRHTESIVVRIIDGDRVETIDIGAPDPGATSG